MLTRAVNDKRKGVGPVGPAVEVRRCRSSGRHRVIQLAHLQHPTSLAARVYMTTGAVQLQDRSIVADYKSTLAHSYVHNTIEEVLQINGLYIQQYAYR